jgi:hypothetical protein
MLRVVSSHNFPRVAQVKIYTGSFTMTASLSKEPRRFAPLGEKGQDASKDLPRLKGVVFDVDGTLW